MQQPEIPTISKVAPPSYAEAMGYPTPKDNQHVPMAGQSHIQQPQGAPYPTPMSMPVPMPMPTPSYQNENNFYHGNTSQPPYSTPPYPTQTPYQPPPGSVATGPHQCIIHNEAVFVPQRRFKDRCCNKKVTVAVICIILIVYMIKQRLHLEKRFADEITKAQY